MTLRESLFRCVDDSIIFKDIIQEAKFQVVSNGDPLHYLQQAEVYLNKIIENFNVITKEIDSVQKNPKTNSTLP